jgi:quercetin dioxygenase-like cupin family protein
MGISALQHSATVIVYDLIAQALLLCVEAIFICLCCDTPTAPKHEETMMNSHKAVAVSLALLSAAFFTSAALAEGAGLIASTPSELKWTAAPSVGPGAMIAVIEGDLKAAEPFTLRLKLPANTKIGVHTHPVTERVTVISGIFYFATGDTFDSARAKAYQPGDTLIIPVGMPMYGASREQETVLQLHGTGPWGITYLNPADDPRNSKM